MPILAWRTDSDGFCFSNSWALDATERAALAGIATPIAAQAGPLLAAIFPPLFLDPVTMSALSTAAIAAANVVISTTSSTFGMCGGMAYTSLDYWHAKMPIPCGGNGNDQPAPPNATQAAVRSMIWGRLLDSLSSGGCIKNTILWSLVLNQLPPALGGGGGTLQTWTVKEWIKIKATIDSGNPCPIGLIYNKRDIWNQHQILVYGYEDFGTGGRLYVYDNIFPHAFGEAGHTDHKDVVDFNFNNQTFTATSPDDDNDSLAGFFTTAYSAKIPAAGLATNFGEFVNFVGDKRTWMPAYGAVLPIASAAELTALGGSPAGVRPTSAGLPAPLPRPRDNALLREHSSAPVFLYEGGCPFFVPDPTTLNLFGGFAAVRVVPDKTLPTFIGPPDDGTLLREVSGTHVFQINGGKPSLSTVAASNASVRVVFNGAISALFLDSVTLSVPRVSVGGSCVGTVHLKTAFPDGDLVISLTTNQPTLVSVPATVTVFKNNLTNTFPITVNNVALSGTVLAVGITATLGGASVTAPLILQLPRIKTFTLSPTTVIAGQSSMGTITIESPYPADIVVNLLCATGFVSTLSPVTIGKNTTKVTFPVNTPASAIPFAPATADIQASYADVVADAILTVQPSVVAGIVQSVSLSPASVAAGGTVNGTVTLMAAVGTSTNVGMTSLPMGPGGPGTTSPLVASITPATVVVAAGSTVGHFQVKTKSGSTGQAKIEAIAVKFALATLTVT